MVRCFLTRSLALLLLANTVFPRGAEGQVASDPTVRSIRALISSEPLESDGGTLWSVRFHVVGQSSASCPPDFRELTIDGSLIRIDTWWPFSGPCTLPPATYEVTTSEIRLVTGTYTVEFWNQDLIASRRVLISSAGDFLLETTPLAPRETEPFHFKIDGVWRDGCVPTRGDVQIAGSSIVVRGMGASCGANCPSAVTSYSFATDPIGPLDAGNWSVDYRVVECAGEASIGERSVTVLPAVDPPACLPASDVLCVDGPVAGDRRFRIEVEYNTERNGGLSGVATLVEIPSSDLKGGLFWFFTADNPEMMVKVLNGCGVNRQFWVFASALTDVGYSVVVSDTETGAQWKTDNEDGEIALPVADTSAFPCE